MAQIGSIEVIQYRKPLGGSASAHRDFSNLITSTLNHELHSINIRKIDTYNLDHEQHNFGAGTRDRLVIYGNATYANVSVNTELETGAVINELGTTHTKFLGTTGIEGNVLINSKEGMTLAEYSPQNNELNILFDVFNEYTPVNCTIFTYIIQEFERLVWYPKTLENSWIHTSNKDALTERFTQRLKQQATQNLENDKYRLRENEERIEERKRQIKQDWTNVLRLRRSIETETATLDNVGSKFINELDLISKHPKITDLHIIEGIFHIWTTDIYCYADTGKRYYIGKCKFTINMENTDVKFFNLNNTRQGFWTRNDPHPHVDGAGGHACLGSVASTIAELCAMNEAYALAMMCIDFLENANTSDPAGARIRSWDEVDEEGNIVSTQADENTWTCDYCDDQFSEDHEGTHVYASYNGGNDGNGTWGAEQYVCQDCRDEYYTYQEEIDEVVADGNCNITDDEEEDEDDDI